MNVNVNVNVNVTMRDLDETCSRSGIISLSNKPGTTERSRRTA